MYFCDTTLDDLLRRVLEKLVNSKNRTRPTRGAATEITGVMLQLTNPRARLSRTEKKGKVFSCLGELLWYLSKTNDLRFIRYYVQRYEEESDDNKTVYGGYGPRLFRMRRGRRVVNQIANVLNLLKRRPDSRRAVIQLFDAADIDHHHLEIPCTCTLQFMIRRKRLHMFTSMRSNDAFFGLPHDVFAFTMLQEILARSLDIDVGRYKHFVGSLHLYDDQAANARQYLSEGFQERVSMPPMPAGDPWSSVSQILKAETVIRSGKGVNIPELGLDPYWADLVRLLQIYSHSKKGETKQIVGLRRTMCAAVYDPYIEEKRRAAAKRAKSIEPQQLELL